MKKEIPLLFTKIIYSIFTVSTIITIFIIYKHIENKVANRFVIVYAILAFLFLFYIILLAILNIKNLNWIQIRGRLFKFIIYSIFLSISGFIFDYFFSPLSIDLFKNFSIAVGLAFVISCNDIIFFRKKNKLI